MKFGNLLLVALFVFATSTTFAQGDFETVASTFNEVASKVSEDLDGTIKGFEEILPQAEALGDEGAEIVEKIKSQLPKLYYKKAATYYKSKDYANSITAFEKTKEVAEKYDNAELAKKAKGIVPKLCYAQGAKEAKAKNYDAAVDYLTKATTMKKKYPKAHYTLGTTYKKMKDATKAEAAFNMAIEQGDETIQTKAKAAMLSMFIADGKSKSAKKDYAGAVASLQKAAGFAGDNADKAAQINFELGKIYKAQGKKGEACAAFKKAMSGPYLESAKYEVETELKCN